MDSCQLFNFLFGTKKMTTELSKCFSSMANQGTKGSGREKTGEGTSKSGSSDHCTSQTPPPSPLKQLQQRLVTSWNNSVVNSKKAGQGQGKNEPGTSCDSHCGTYRATLVESLPDDELTLIEQSDDTIVNPSHGEAASVRSESPTSSTTNLHHTESKDGEKNTNSNIDKEPYERSSLVLVEPMRTQQTHPPALDDSISEQGNQREAGENLSNSIYKQGTLNGSMGAKCKRVVLYSECEPNQEQKQIVASSAEVYNIVSELGETRARLRRVGSLTNRCLSREEDNNQISSARAQENYNSNDINNSPLLEDQLDTYADRDCDRLKDKRNVYVRSLVQSFESNNSLDSSTLTRCRHSMDHNNNNSPLSFSKPVTFVKPMPPKTPPKTVKAKCLNMQLSLKKPSTIQQLFLDEIFLQRLFNHLDPLDRCTAAQVCRAWRNILYADQNYWKDLVMVVDCIQMRREHLVDCILNTLQTAKLKHHKNNAGSDTTNRPIKANRSFPSKHELPPVLDWPHQNHYPATATSRGFFDYQMDSNSISESVCDRKQDSSLVYDFDLDDVWRIQELCNRYAQRTCGHTEVGQHFLSESNGCNQQLAEQQKQVCTASKSSSIPSQISSTLSSVSLSSLLSPLSESSRIDTLKEKLYFSLDNRGFNSLCLYGATNEDIEDLISKTSTKTLKKITSGRFNNCSITNSGLETFMEAFDQLEELEIRGCNDITNSLEMKPLPNLKRLTITDCINIADGIAQQIYSVVGQLDELTIQAYHLTDAFIDYLIQRSDVTRMKKLEVLDCKEVTNLTLVNVSKNFFGLEALSISGATKMTDEGMEILTDRLRTIRVLDLSWCTRITDMSLDCIACDLGASLEDLILDRNINITDVGLGYVATMSKLQLLHIRWCSRVTDVGLEAVITIESLRYLSIAGIHQITARSLLCLAATNLLEVELTNCPAVNNELSLLLSEKMPKCNIIL